MVTQDLHPGFALTDSVQSLPLGAPQLVREQYGVLLQSMDLFSSEDATKRPAIELFTIEIQTRKDSEQVPPNLTSRTGKGHEPRRPSYPVQ